MIPAIFVAAIEGAIIAKVASVLGVALIVFAGGWAISKIGKTALEAISRQPESADGIRMSMIIVAALVEGISLFAIIVCLLVAL